MSVFCIACKPGYKPIYFSSESIIIVDCVKIEFC